MRDIVFLLVFLLALPALPAQAPARAPSGAPAPRVIPVVVASYFPLAGENIDIRATGDWGRPYAETKAKCERLTRELAGALEKGSTFRGYKDPRAAPSLTYEVLASFEFRRALPTRPLRPGEQVPLPDYQAVMEEIGIREWVGKRGVKQVWLWAYHGGVIGLWESNMSSPFGDVSNSNRDPGDLPVLESTYTVFHFNYQRGLGEALENHMHQLEALLNHADGRDRTPPEKWGELLFWGRFVGSDASHKIVARPARCGWTHYAPNSESDYDWQNKRLVETDIEDWKPDGIGATRSINAARWNFDPVQWRIYWLQAIPGAGNGLTFQGRKLRDWWSFVHDWDRAKRENWTLVEERPVRPASRPARAPGGA